MKKAKDQLVNAVESCCNDKVYQFMEPCRRAANAVEEAGATKLLLVASCSSERRHPDSSFIQAVVCIIRIDGWAQDTACM